VVVALINRLVTDLIESVSQRVDARGLDSVAAVRACPERLVQFSPELEKRKRELKKFLYDEMYQHPQVLAMNERRAHPGRWRGPRDRGLRGRHDRPLRDARAREAGGPACLTASARAPGRRAPGAASALRSGWC
jgi:hypothetical protein